MAKCARCGAETILYVDDVPTCTKCDSKPDESPRFPPQVEPPNPPEDVQKRIRVRQLVSQYQRATAEYHRDVQNLVKVAGSLEADAFRTIYERCQRSQRLCASLRNEIVGLAAEIPRTRGTCSPRLHQSAG